MKLSGPLNQFGVLLLRHCDRVGWTLHKLVQEARLSSHSRIYYAIRPKATKRRVTPLTEDEVDQIAQALSLDVEAAQELALVAALEAAAPRIREHIADLQRQVLALQASVSKKSSR